MDGMGMFNWVNCHDQIYGLHFMDWIQPFSVFGGHILVQLKMYDLRKGGFGHPVTVANEGL